MMLKALTTAADEIIIDLEDSVILFEKPKGRENIAEFLTNLSSTKKFTVRINERGSPENAADLELVNSLAATQLLTVMLPKVGSLDDLLFWEKLLPSRFDFEVQIESALGLLNCAAIAAHPRVRSLSFGPADFMASIGMPSSEPGTPWKETPRALEYALLKIVIAAHAYQKLAYDGPYFLIADSEGLTVSARTARALGADGKWAIHPNQIQICNDAFTPTEDEIFRAEEIINVFNSSTGAVSLNGLMVDEASKKVAEAFLERVRRFGG